MTTLPLGSFSSRAHSAEDTVAVLLEALRPYDEVAANRFQERAAQIKPSRRSDTQGLVLSLVRALTAFCPPMTYVGHRLDDPNLWGVWIDLACLHAAEESGQLIQASSANVKTSATYILEVGDRGVILWRKRGLQRLWETS